MTQADQNATQIASELSSQQDIATSILSASQQAGWLLRSGGNVEDTYSGRERHDVSEVCILALSADKEVLQAEIHLRLRVDPTTMQRFVELLKGKRALATWDLAALLRDELIERVLVPEVAKHSASDLRDNRNVLNSLEQKASDELCPVLSAIGLELDSFTVS